MNNPNAPYPGRQLFLGLTGENQPFFAYLITGRSPESRERKGVLVGDTIRIGPLGDQAYDPLRHYSAVKYDNGSGIAAVSNGIQTEAIFEIYRLLHNTVSLPSPEYMQKVLEGAGAEPDSYHTPRIAGLISNPVEKGGKLVFIIGIKAFSSPARAIAVSPRAGKMIGISTYKGSLDNPEARDPGAIFPELEFKGLTAEDLATSLFDISAANYKGNDIRVCAIGGMRSVQNGWSFFIKNVR
jgi:IMP cyclohydrolase